MRVAVVGASLAGLAAGALLARRGCEVTVFDRAPKPEVLSGPPPAGCAPGWPGDHLVWGWRSSRALVRLFGSLRDRPGASARHLFQSVPTGLQVLGHPYRLDWGPEVAVEIGREFPGAIESWEACQAAWDRQSWGLQRTGLTPPFLGPQGRPAAEPEEGEASPGELQPRPEAPFLESGVEALPEELRSCLEGVALAAAWRPPEAVSLSAWLWARELLEQEVGVLKEGRDGLVRWLAGRLEAAGGCLRWATPVTAVRLRSRRVRAVTIREGRRRAAHEAAAVVVAGGELSELLPWRWRWAQKRRSEGALVACQLVVEAEAVAEPLAPLAVYRGGPDQPPLLISYNPVQRRTWGERPRHGLTIGWRAEEPGADELELVSELPKRLERLMPFLPGRWELDAHGESGVSPVRRQTIPVVAPSDLGPTTRVAGLMVAAKGLLPGLSTTTSLALGVAAADAVLRER